jgi:hypothetical protein
MGKANTSKSETGDGPDSGLTQSPLWKPKFLSSAFVQVTGAIALFTRLIDGGTYVALSSLALGIYVAGNVSEQKVLRDET